MLDREQLRTLLDHDRFWTKVRKSSDPHGCWTWTASADKRWGYGLFSWSRDAVGHTVKAHRYSWEIAFGPIPEGMSVLHSCDTPACVRPDHLHLGTHQSNMDEMYERGRGRKVHGEEHHSAKLTEADVREIRRRWDDGRGERQVALAAEYGVAQGIISSVCRRRTWAHVS